MYINARRDELSPFCHVRLTIFLYLRETERLVFKLSIGNFACVFYPKNCSLVRNADIGPLWHIYSWSKKHIDKNQIFVLEKFLFDKITSYCSRQRCILRENRWARKTIGYSVYTSWSIKNKFKYGIFFIFIVLVQAKLTFFFGFFHFLLLLSLKCRRKEKCRFSKILLFYDFFWNSAFILVC